MSKVFAVYDKKSEFFGTPFFAVNEGVAKRNFDALVNDGESFVSKYPDDYSLYCIGDYDDVKGKIVGYEVPQLIVL